MSKKTTSKKPATKKPTTTKKEKLVVSEELGRDEKSFERLVKAWVSTTVKNDKVDDNELWHRLGTLFVVSCGEMGISFLEAKNILGLYVERVAENMGVENPWVCDECLAADETDLLLGDKASLAKTDKLLN